MTVNRTLASLLWLVLLAVATPCCSAQDEPLEDESKESEDDGKPKPRRRRRGHKDFMLAEPEAGGMVSMVNLSGNGLNSAGDYFVWTNELWGFDDDENHAPTVPIGTSRGQCVLLADDDVSGKPVAGHCAWTLTIHNEEDEESDKLMILGDVDDLEWGTVQTLAIVGGTGKYEGEKGVIEVVSQSNFFIYDIMLD